MTYARKVARNRARMYARKEQEIRQEGSKKKQGTRQGSMDKSSKE